MAETIKCACSNCGAKYRLPAEAQGRTARCKRCGEKFHIPPQKSLEDTIQTWLNAPTEGEAEEAAPAKPRVINMPGSDDAEDTRTTKVRSAIRLKSNVPKEQTG